MCVDLAWPIVLPSAVKTDEWRVLNEIPDSDVVEIIRDEMADSGEEEENPGVMSNREVEQRARKWAK